MENYREMYGHLFNTITEVIDQLQAAQRETEEIFISQEPGTQPLPVSRQPSLYTDVLLCAAPTALIRSNT
jgi:hypothetical protein